MLLNRLLAPAMRAPAVQASGARVAAAKSLAHSFVRQPQQCLATKGPDNKFLGDRFRAEERAAKSSGLWKKISLLVALPVMAITGANAYLLWNEHLEPRSTKPPLDGRIEHSYQSVRTKKFPWGDGSKIQFWNSSDNHGNHDKHH